MKIFRCLNCMQEMNEGQTVCGRCGHDNSKVDERTYSLLPNTILHGRYLVGNMLGQGGFGITYIGFDFVLNIKVAIKEYYPRSNASRDNRISQKLFWNAGPDTMLLVEEGRNNFLEEARRMAKIDTIPEIVRIRDTFEENESVYIIMDYVEGVTLKNYIVTNGVMKISECLELLAPLMTGLDKIHEKGIIHRDISPDNIMIEQNGAIRLLDLGAAADLRTGSKYQAVAKKGFSPIEQYSQNGDIGPWTDVYAICATIYYCVTGTVMPLPGKRINEDAVASDIKSNKAISAGQKAALIHGLAIKPQDRTQSVKDLMKQFGIAPGPFNFVKKAAKKVAKTVMSHKIISAACILVATIIVYLLAAKPWIVTVKLLGQSNSNMSNGGCFTMIDGEYAYLIMNNNALCIWPYADDGKKLDASKAVKVMDNAGSINVAEDKIYFVAHDEEDVIDITVDDRTFSLAYSTVYSMNYDGSDVSEVFSGLYISNLQYAKLSNGHRVFFFFEYDTDGDRTLNMYDMGSKKKKELIGNDILWYNVYGRYIYYTRFTEDNIIFARRNISGGREEILDKESNYIDGVFDDAGFYMFSLDDATLHGVTADGKRTESFVENIDISVSQYDSLACRYAIGGNWLYYVNSIDKSLHRVDPKSGGDYVIAEYEMPEEICYSNGYIWISDLISNGSINKRLSASVFLENGGSRVELFSDGWEINRMAEKQSIYERLNEDDAELFDVETAVFLGDLNDMPENAYDFSSENNGSVMAWVDNKTLYIGANGGVNGKLAAEEMFFGFHKLKKVYFGRSFHTDYAKSLSKMFKSCEALESVDIEQLVTKNVTDFSEMFYGCNNLTKLDVSNFDTSKAIDMCSMFHECHKLTKLDVSGFNTSNVINMSSMFRQTWELTELDVSHFDTSKVTDMEYMFSDCSGLTKLDVSNFNTSNVTDMSFMFDGCISLTKLDVSGFDTSKVAKMDCMFMYCSILKELDVSNFNTSKVESMSSMFNDCRGLKELDVSGFDTSKVNSMGAMFKNCLSLTKLDVSNFNTSKVVKMDSMFEGCSGLASLDLSGFDMTNVTSSRAMTNGVKNVTMPAPRIDLDYSEINL